MFGGAHAPRVQFPAPSLETWGNVFDGVPNPTAGGTVLPISELRNGSTKSTPEQGPGTRLGRFYLLAVCRNKSKLDSPDKLKIAHILTCQMSNNNPIDLADPKEPTKSNNPPNPPHIPPAEHRPENQNPSQETWKELAIWKKFERVFKVLEAVGIAAGIAVLLVLVGQYEEMKTSRMEDERAWVFTRGIARESFNGIQQESNSATFKIEIKNSGKTPALNFRSVIGYDNQTNDIGKIDTLDTNDFMVLPPDVSVYEFLPVSVKKGDSLWVVGINRYDDIFGKHHWSTFCWKVEGDKFDIFAGTPFHNTCDDALTNQTN